MKTQRYFWLFTALFWGVAAAVFWGAWSPAAAFVQPDQAIHFPVDEARRFFASLADGGRFIPSDLVQVLGGMAFWQEAYYAAAAYLAALGMAFYLRGRNLSPLAQYGTGAIYALMGYNFTIYSAGHLGWFIFLMYGPWAFGLIDRAIRTRRIFYWFILGVTLAWASAQQPDIWMMFALLMIAYGIWCCARERVFVKILPGAALALAAMLVAGTPQFTATLTDTVASRQSQIDATSDAASKAEKQSSADGGNWVFCTNWSLPPEDALEFFWPDLHGVSNDPRVSPDAPYTGRLGIQYAPGKWQPYRQHGLYFGALTWIFVAFAVTAMFRNGRKGEQAFWLAAAAATFLFALGGFTPFYRIVYALPFGDLVRCPVKFVHLTEWCVAVLAGFGIDALQKRVQISQDEQNPIQNQQNALHQSVNSVTDSVNPVKSGASRKAFWVVAALVAADAIDLARVDRHYFALDETRQFFVAENDVAAHVAANGGGAVAVLLAPQQGGGIVRESLRDHLADAPDAPPEGGFRWYLAPWHMAAQGPLAAPLRQGRFAVEGGYSLSLEKGLRKSAAKTPPLVLVRDKSVSAPPPRSDTPTPLLRRIAGYASLAVSLAAGLAIALHTFTTGKARNA